MRNVPFALVFIFLLFAMNASSQTTVTIPAPEFNGPAVGIGGRTDGVANDISKISQAVDTLNRNLGTFFNTFSSNQGLKLSEKQQKLLLALEILSRTESSLNSAQKMKLEYIERLSRFRLQLAGISDSLLPQSVDRYATLRGTTNADEIRELRRQSLNRERVELSNAIAQIQRDVDRLNDEIRRNELQVANLRTRLFGEIDRELADL